MLLIFAVHIAGTDARAQSGERAQAGFLPPAITLFAPSIYLASPGPERARRSIVLFESQIDFYRAVLFHPVLTPKLQAIQDAMPPRQVTMLRAARLYSDPHIPWIRKPDGAHEIIVAGERQSGNFVYRSASDNTTLTPGAFLSHFALRPAEGPSDPNPASVIGRLEGGFELESYGVDALIDVAAAALRQCYGDLHGPWDVRPGVFNQHDRAAIGRMRRDMPALAAQLHRFFAVANVVDEFAGGPAGPNVLFNLEFTVRPGALTPFPYLNRFYSRIGPRVHALITFEDDQSGNWTIIEFDRGRTRVVFLDSAGLLRNFGKAYGPAGIPIALGHVTQGRYRVGVCLDYTRFGLSFGLDDLSFVTDYRRDAAGVRFETHMIGTPTVVAPPVLRAVVAYLADQFLESLAGGMRAGLTSRTLPAGRVEVAAEWSAELSYSPGLEILARVGDSIADAHNAAVRADERRLGEDMFDALIADYRRARPAIMAVDNIAGQSGDSR